MEGKGGGRGEATLKPLRSSIVRLRYYKKSGPTEADEKCRKFDGLYKYLYLLSLTPDLLALYTTKDAGTIVAEEAYSSTPKMRSLKNLVKASVRQGGRKEALSPSAQEGGEEGAARAGAASACSSSTPSELDEDQVFTVSVSLNQIVSITVHDERCLKVTFRPNKPSRKKMDETTLTAIKGLFFPLWYPVEAMVRDNWSPEVILESHMRKDPHLHTFVIEAPDAQEALALKAAIESAIQRLQQALSWLSKDLPLLDRSTISLVTMDCPPQQLPPHLAVPAPAAAAAAARGRAGQAQRPQQPQQAQQLVVATQPCFGDRVPLPDGISACVAARQAGCADDDNDGASGPARPPVALHVWLHTPLGPAQAQLVPCQLLEDEEAAAGCPFTLRTVPTDVTKAAGAFSPIMQQGAASERRLEVLLRCCLVQGEELASAGAHSRGIAGGGRGAWLGGGGAAKWDERVWMQLLAIAAVLLVVLLNWAQMGSGGSSAAAEVLRCGSYLATSICGVGAIGLLAFRFQQQQQAAGGGGRRAPATSDTKGGPSLYRWYLELLEADLVEVSTGVEGGAEGDAATPPMVRTLAVSTAGGAQAQAAPGKTLPKPIQRLMDQHPNLVNANIAERFLIGWGTSSSAYSGLLEMVTWMQQQGLEGVVNHPQPRFELIKKHYRHGVFGKSKTDCPVEIECTGSWKAAYEALRREGVTEQEMLHHLVFIYESTFTLVDPRPLPHGRTVKIVDLEGLAMTDIRCDAFRFLTKVGALLNMNYPQRLHRCFLVNAPTWWSVAWKMISPMIYKKTREQMFLFAKNDKESMKKAILEEVDPDQLPVEYGGTCTVPLYDSAYEKELAQHVRRCNSAAVAPAAGTGAAVGSVGAAAAGGVGPAAAAGPAPEPAASPSGGGATRGAGGG